MGEGGGGAGKGVELKGGQSHSQCSVYKSLFLKRCGRVPGEIKRSRDLRGGRWSWTLTFAQKRS